MFCSKCGKKIVDNAKFCDGCGNMIINTSSENKKPENIKRNQGICVKCSGSGYVRSTVKLICCIILVVLLIGSQLSGLPVMFLTGDAGVVFFIFAALSLDIGLLYWGFKKKMCPVCHGRGKVNL